MLTSILFVQPLQTPVCKNDRNPNWFSTLVFNGARFPTFDSDASLGQELTIEVWDADTGSNDAVGSLRVDIPTIRELSDQMKQYVTEWCLL